LYKKVDIHAGFPELGVSRMYRIHNTFRRSLSGGMNFKQLVPGSAEVFLKAIEKVLSPLSHLWSIDQVIVLRKKTASSESA
jgi:hypothetical protein